MRFQIMLICLVVLAFLSPASGAEKVIKFSEDPWPPYTFGEAGKAPEGGIAVDIIDAIFLKVAVDTEMMLYPWKRCLQQMQKGERDAIMLLGYSEQRESYLVYSDLIVDVNDLVYFRKGHHLVDWNSIEDFKSMRFARPLGFQFGKEFETAVRRRHIKISEVNNDLQAFNLLIEERVDAVVCNEVTARLLFKEQPEIAKKCVAGNKPFKSAPLFMAFSRKSKYRSLLDKVNIAINELRNDGTIDRIVDNYLD